MKELLLEEKAKAYDEAIKRAKAMIPVAANQEEIYNSIITIFPELKESEDEKIRQLLLRFVKYDMSDNYSDDFTPADCVAWLEKQGKNNMGISEATKKKLEDSLNEALEKETPESFNKFLDEQGEQKPDNELKFEIGDLITNGILVGKIDEIHELGYHAYFGDHYADVPDVENWHKWTIQDAKDGDVLCTKNKCCPFIYDKERYNNGLAYYYAGIDVSGNLNIKSPHNMLAHFGRLDNIQPATKEQRNLLFKKMHEAGYEWDAEKKELKKVEQKQVIDYPDSLPKDNWELVHEFVSKFGRVPKDEDELNVLVEYVLKRKNHSEWSEEDEQYKSGLIGLVENSKAGLPINLRGKAADKCIYWLKSLKDRVQPQNSIITDEELAQAKKDAYNNVLDKIEYDSENPTFDDGWSAAIWYLKKRNAQPQKQWKPSDEQMRVLDLAIRCGINRGTTEETTLVSLFNDLKKLK